MLSVEVVTCTSRDKKNSMSSVAVVIGTLRVNDNLDIGITEK